jgi:ABC-type transport system involved in multi-copper enzyme maturation permease subunit
LRFQLPSRALVKRELLSNLRRVPSFLCLVLFVGFCILIVVNVWPAEVINITIVGGLARALIGFVTYSMLFAAAIFVPALAAGSIVTEKERRTFDLLILTLISPGGIIAGKLLNTVGFYLLLIMAVMPVLGVIFFLVGVDWVVLIQSFCIVLATSVSCAMVGILSSAFFKRTFAAIAGAYLGMVVLMVGFLLPFALVVLVIGMAESGRAFEWWSTVISPVVALGKTQIPMLGLSWWEFAFAMLYQVVFISVCARLTLRILRRPQEPLKVETRKPIDNPLVLEARRKTFPFYLIDPLRRKKQIDDQQNPMMVRELRWGLMNRGTILVRVCYSMLILYFLVGCTSIYLQRSYESIFPWLILQMVLTVALIPALVGNLFTKEYELGNIDMLRMTLLKPRQIVLGKAVAGAISVAPALIAAILAAVPALFLKLGSQEWLLLLTGYTTLFVCALVALALSIFASLLTRRTSTSLVLSYVFNAFVFVGLFGICMFVAEVLINWRGTPQGLGAASAFTSPIGAFVFGIAETHWRGSPSHNMYWASNVVLFMLFSAGLMMLCVRGFERYRMRDR